MVVVFNPMNDPSVAENLKAEQKKNPKVVELYSHPGLMGLIETPKGTFCIDCEGVGDENSIDKNGVKVHFYRKLEDGFEVMPFATATYSLADCKACAVGDPISLHEFIEHGKTRKEENYQQWNTFLDGQV